MNRKLTIFALVCCFAFLAISCFTSVSAQVSGDWNISSDWSSPTPSPTASPSPNPTQRQYNTFIGYVLLALLIFGLLPMILVILYFSKGHIDGKTGAALFITVTVFIALMLITYIIVGAFGNVPVG